MHKTVESQTITLPVEGAYFRSGGCLYHIREIDGTVKLRQVDHDNRPLLTMTMPASNYIVITPRPQC
jgi:hypothetical protein